MTSHNTKNCSVDLGLKELALESLVDEVYGFGLGLTRLFLAVCESVADLGVVHPISVLNLYHHHKLISRTMITVSAVSEKLSFKQLQFL